MSIGIYALYWSTPDLIYIGQTITLEKRFEQHLSLLRNGKHFNTGVQRTFDIYGIPEYFILKEVHTSLLDSEEISLIKEFNAFNSERGLNASPGGCSSFGEAHPNSLYLNKDIETAFLLLYDRKLPHKDISTHTNISLGVIKAISSGKLHGWLSEKYPKEYASMLNSVKFEHNSGELHPMSKIPNSKVEEVFLLLISRESSLVSISKATNVPYSIVSLIACGKSHKWLESKYPDSYKKMLSNTGKHSYKFPKITNGIEVIEVTNATTFCKERNLQHPNLSKVFSGSRKSHKGWYLYKEPNE